MSDVKCGYCEGEGWTYLSPLGHVCGHCAGVGTVPKEYEIRRLQKYLAGMVICPADMRTAAYQSASQALRELWQS